MWYLFGLLLLKSLVILAYLHFGGRSGIKPYQDLYPSDSVCELRVIAVLAIRGTHKPWYWLDTRPVKDLAVHYMYNATMYT